MQTNENTSQDTIIDAGENPTIEGAVTVVKEVDHALVVTNPEQYAKDLFEPFFAELTSARRRASAAKYDVTTPAGMEAAKLHEQTFTKIRTRADKLKIERKKPIDQAGKVILAEFERLATAAKAEQDKHAKAIKDEKDRLEKIEEAKRQAQRVRIEAIEARLVHIRGIPGKYAKADAATLKTTIDELLAKQLDPALYDEFLEQAAEAMIETTEALRQLHADAVASEAQAAELERLRKAEADREAAAKVERDAAAEREKVKDDELAKLRAQLAALQPKPAPEPEPAAAPVAQPGATPMADRQPINPQGQYYSTTTFKDNGEPILCNADGTRSIFCDIADDAGPVELMTETPPCANFAAPAATPAPVRPSDKTILEAVAVHFDVPAVMALSWLSTFDAHAAHILMTEA